MTNRFLQKYNGDWPPANPYADSDSPKSKALRESTHPMFKPFSTTLTSYKKECRDGGKGQKEKDT